MAHSQHQTLIVGVFLLTSFVALFPLSSRLADPLFTHPFLTGWQYEYPVLLLWPDHVELRWFQNVSEVSPIPKGAGYTFRVPPERQTWVEHAIRSTASPNGSAAWVIQIQQIDSARRRIQLELLGDGITGIVYEAEEDKIIPLKSRLAGPAGAFAVLLVHLTLWGSICILARFCFRAWGRRQMNLASRLCLTP